MEDPIASTSQQTKNNGSEKRLKKKNKKREEVPFPGLCSAVDARNTLDTWRRCCRCCNFRGRSDEVEVTITECLLVVSLRFRLCEELGSDMYVLRFWNWFNFEG